MSAITSSMLRYYLKVIADVEKMNEDILEIIEKDNPPKRIKKLLLKHIEYNNILLKDIERRWKNEK